MSAVRVGHSQTTGRLGTGISCDAIRTTALLAPTFVAVVLIVIAAPELDSTGAVGKVALQALGGAAIVLATAVARRQFRTLATRSGEVFVLALAFMMTSTSVMVIVAAFPALSPSAPLASGLAFATPLGAALLAMAALMPDATAERSETRSRFIVTGGVLCVAVLGLGAAIGAVWPGLRLASAGAVGLDHLARHSSMIGSIEGLTAMLFAIAAVGFARRARRHVPPRSARWLAIGAVSAAGAHLDYLLAPARTTSSVSVGDLLWAVSMCALAFGAFRQIESSWQRRHDEAVAEERSRLAREIHDSVAQELAFILGQSRDLVDAYPRERALADIASAAAHALDGARSAIYGLVSGSHHSLGEAVRARARELASRSGLELRLDVPDGIQASGEVENAILSIVQEAISNAARHADAGTLEISMRARGDTIAVRISDDGRGFDQVSVAPSRIGGFGLRSMHDRALALGGDLKLESTPGKGTTIEVEV